MVKYLYRHLFLFVDRCLYLLPVRSQILEHCTFNCHLPVSAVFGHHKGRFYINMHEKECRGEGLPYTVSIVKYIEFWTEGG